MSSDRADIASNLSPIDRVYLERACELAQRGRGSTSPNPSVGAVIVNRTGRTIGEGFHRVHGSAHAEVEALRDAARRGHADDVHGATMYVTLEPCNHYGRTPPCSEAVVAAGIARIVIGALDPNPRTAGGGIRTLQAANVEVVVAHPSCASSIIDSFRITMLKQRPYIILKMAASIDGKISPRSGIRYALTGETARRFVRELRSDVDAIMIGAETARIDDPTLLLRPTRSRRKNLRRIIVCGSRPLSADLQIFEVVPGYDRTILAVPQRYAATFDHLRDKADVLLLPDGPGTNRKKLSQDDMTIQPHSGDTQDENPTACIGNDFPAAPSGGSDVVTSSAFVPVPELLSQLYAFGITSILCEGGPSLAAALLAHNVVDRVEWLIAPTFIGSGPTVAALGSLHGDNGDKKWRIQSTAALAADLRITLTAPA